MRGVSRNWTDFLSAALRRESEFPSVIGKLDETSAFIPIVDIISRRRVSWGTERNPKQIHVGVQPGITQQSNLRRGVAWLPHPWPINLKAIFAAIKTRVCKFQSQIIREVDRLATWEREHRPFAEITDDFRTYIGKSARTFLIIFRFLPKYSKRDSHAEKLASSKTRKRERPLKRSCAEMKQRAITRTF